MKTYATMMTAVGMALFARSAGAALDLNSATAAQMQAELGLSRGEAMQIIERREQKPFQSPDELSKLPGFDAQKTAQLKGKLTASPAGPKVAKASKGKKASAKKKSGRKGTKRAKSKTTRPPSTGTVDLTHRAPNGGRGAQGRRSPPPGTRTVAAHPGPRVGG